MQAMRPGTAIQQACLAFTPIAIHPFTHGPRADAYGCRDNLRPLPARNQLNHPSSTVRRKTGILVDVHSVPRERMKPQQPQLPRSGPDGQPVESSNLGRERALGAVADSRVDHGGDGAVDARDLPGDLGAVVNHRDGAHVQLSVDLAGHVILHAIADRLKIRCPAGVLRGRLDAALELIDGNDVLREIALLVGRRLGVAASHDGFPEPGLHVEVRPCRDRRHQGGKRNRAENDLHPLLSATAGGNIVVARRGGNPHAARVQISSPRRGRIALSGETGNCAVLTKATSPLSPLPSSAVWKSLPISAFIAGSRASWLRSTRSKRGPRTSPSSCSGPRRLRSKPSTKREPCCDWPPLLPSSRWLRT